MKKINKTSIALLLVILSFSCYIYHSNAVFTQKRWALARQQGDLDALYSMSYRAVQYIKSHNLSFQEIKNQFGVPDFCDDETSPHIVEYYLGKHGFPIPDDWNMTIYMNKTGYVDGVKTHPD